MTTLATIEAAVGHFVANTEHTIETIVSEGSAFASSPTGQAFWTFLKGFLAGRGVTPADIAGIESMAHSAAQMAAALQVAAPGPLQAPTQGAAP